MPIKIVSDGNPQKSFIEKDGVQLDNVTSIKINIEPDEIRAQVDFIFPELDLKLPHEIDSVKVGGETFVRLHGQGKPQEDWRTRTWTEHVLEYMIWRFHLRPRNLTIKFVPYTEAFDYYILPVMDKGKIEDCKLVPDHTDPAQFSIYYTGDAITLSQFKVWLYHFGSGIRAGACVELNTLIVSDQLGEMQRECQRLGLTNGAIRPHWRQGIPTRSYTRADPTGR